MLPRALMRIQGGETLNLPAVWLSKRRTGGSPKRAANRTELPLRAKHCLNCFVCINSWDLHDDTVRREYYDHRFIDEKTEAWRC